MPRWTINELNEWKRRHPDIQIVGSGKNSTAQPNPRPRALAKGKAKEENPRRFLVRITSVRSRLGDPDGIVGKWHLDALRYAGCLQDDTAELLNYEVSQRKCSKGEEEHTEIEVYKLT